MRDHGINTTVQLINILTLIATSSQSSLSTDKGEEGESSL